MFPHFLFRKLVINLIKFKINNVIRNDCLVFDDEEYSKENFFNKTIKHFQFRSQNINILFPLETATLINRNLIYSDIYSKL